MQSPLARDTSTEELIPDAERLHILSARVLTIQEEERRHISRELHDDVGQSLTALKFGLHRLGAMVDGAAARTLVSECFALTDATLERVREISHGMRPPQLDELGLEDAVRWLVERQKAVTGQAVRAHFNGLLGRRFPEAMESTCYRIIQEALGNAMKHAAASSILVAVEAGKSTLRVLVRDDGTGFEPGAARVAALRSGSMGLIGMEERAHLAGGTFAVTSEPGSGTIVRLAFELPQAGS